MILADNISFDHKTTFNQGKFPMCQTYAFLALLIEHIQQIHDIDISFDFKKTYDKMITLYSSTKGRKSFVGTLARIARIDGIETLDGKYLVKIDECSRLSKDPRQIRKFLQMYGTLLWWVRMYKNYSLSKSGTGDFLYSFPKKPIRGSYTHLMTLDGYKSTPKKKGFKFYNSWGEKASPKYIQIEDFKKLTIKAYAIKGVSLTKLK